jgi:hypothetical protein
MRFAIVDEGVVINIVLVDPESGWTPDSGSMYELDDTSLVSIGWSLADGVFTPPAPAVEPVPQSITPLQARKGLRASGLKPMVDAYISTLPEEDQEEWEYALEIRRDSPIIAASAALLPTPLTEEEVDELFRQWSKL